MIVLGCVELRKPRQLEKLQVCLASLRHHNPDIRIVMFNRSPEDVNLYGLLKRYQIEDVDVKGWAEEWGPLTTRNLYYRKWMETETDRAVLIDTFDVIAQGDLNTLAVTDRMVVSQENHRLADCPYNAPWMRYSFQLPVDDALLEKPIICCGVVAGPALALRAYLDWFLSVLHTKFVDPPASIHRHLYPLDQSALNIYAYDAAQNVEVLPYVNAQFMHVGYSDPLTLGWDVDRKVVAYDADTVPLLLHQYNRHPHIHKRITDRYGYL